jgi:hypothetical protein
MRSLWATVFTTRDRRKLVQEFSEKVVFVTIVCMSTIGLQIRSLIKINIPCAETGDNDESMSTL